MQPHPTSSYRAESKYIQISVDSTILGLVYLFTIRGTASTPRPRRRSCRGRSISESNLMMTEILRDLNIFPVLPIFWFVYNTYLKRFKLHNQQLWKLMIPYRVLCSSGTGMVREQEQDRPDGELGEIDVPFLRLDKSDLLRHLGQPEPGVALHEGEGAALLGEALGCNSIQSKMKILRCIEFSPCLVMAEKPQSTRSWFLSLTWLRTRVITLAAMSASLQDPNCEIGKSLIITYLTKDMEKS